MASLSIYFLAGKNQKLQGMEQNNYLKRVCYNKFIGLWDSKSKYSPFGCPPYPYISKSLSSKGIFPLSRPLKPSIGEAHGAGVEGLELDASWFKKVLGFWGEFPAALLLEELAVVREMDADCCCCCWFFIGDFGLRDSISGVVMTRWGASGGGFRPPPPCQIFPSLSAKFLTYAWDLQHHQLALRV